MRIPQNVYLPALFFLSTCGSLEEDHQPSLIDAGVERPHPSDDDASLDAEPFDGGTPDGVVADARVIIDRCDCDDLGPCLILPPACIPGICEYRSLDLDGDGHSPEICTEVGGDDCDDTDPAIYTGAPEICDGEDNNCNGFIDEECSLKGG